MPQGNADPNAGRPRPFRSVRLGAARAGAVDQDPPHQPRGHAQQVTAALPLGGLPTQLQIRLVYQRRGLESLAGAFGPRIEVGQPPELVLYQRDRAIEVRFGHGRNYSRPTVGRTLVRGGWSVAGAPD